jgi:very-short-patch-repair endonuclease
MASQWHCDVVIVDIHTFAIIGAVELDDASHLKKHRIRRDILLEEVLRQAGIPLLRDRDSEAGKKVGEFLKYRKPMLTKNP